ncbi:hypothetical protein GQR36_19245 [Enterococcus termitis]
MTAEQPTSINLYAAKVKASASEQVSVVTKGVDEVSLVLETKGKKNQ